MGCLSKPALFTKLDPRGLEVGNLYHGKGIERWPSRERRGERFVDHKSVIGILLDLAIKAETLDDAALRYLSNVASVGVKGVKGMTDPFRARVGEEQRDIARQLWEHGIKPFLTHLPDGSEVELRRGDCDPWDFVLHVVTGPWAGKTFVCDAHTSGHGDTSLAGYRAFVVKW
jgi:hypothetical protein